LQLGDAPDRYTAGDLSRYLLGLVVKSLAAQGCVRWPDVGPDDLQAVAQELEGRQVARATRVRTAVLLRRFLGWLVDRGAILRSHAHAVPVVDDGEPDLPQPPLSEREVTDLFQSLRRQSVVDLRNICLLELLYGCGLRISEALALKLEHLDLNRQTMLVLDSKHGQDRMVPIPGGAQVATEDYLAVRRALLRGPDRGHLFLALGGRPLSDSAVYSYFRRLNRQGDRHL
jgi:site-specific recombinase XerD